jgi:hypothetical protein
MEVLNSRSPSCKGRDIGHERSIITILVLPLCMMIKFFVEHFMMRTEFFFGIMQRVVEPNPYLGQTRDAASVFSSSNIQKCLNFGELV